MKKFFYSVLSLAVIILSVISCDKDEQSGYVLSQGVGDVYQIENKIITILLDDADTVQLTNSEKFNLKTGLRVSFVGDIISERKSGDRTVYEFRAARIDSVLTKAPLLQSVLNEDKVLADSVGSDQIELTSANIASKYLNVTYQLRHQGIGTKHFINLVVDDVTSPIVVDENGELLINAELRHNGYGDYGYYLSNGFVSFKIGDYTALDGVKKIKMKVRYKINSSTESETTVEYVVKETPKVTFARGIFMPESTIKTK